MNVKSDLLCGDTGSEYDSGDYSQFLVEGTGKCNGCKKSSMQNISIAFGHSKDNSTLLADNENILIEFLL